MSDTFEPFEKVLVRNNYGYWTAAFYSHLGENKFITCGGQEWSDCIPYEDFKELLGTQITPDYPSQLC